ncbi:16922_t:CDS:1, partial [Racocetra persica]
MSHNKNNEGFQPEDNRVDVIDNVENIIINEDNSHQDARTTPLVFRREPKQRNDNEEPTPA